MEVISSLVRSALFVSDLDRSVDFYRDLFALEEVYAEGSLQHETAPKLLGMPPGARIRYKILKAAGPNWGMIGLFETTGPAPPRVEKRRDGCNIGEMCMVFYCADLVAIHNKLVAGGHQVVCPPTHLVVEGHGPGQLEMTFLDPDGIMINLIERDPASEG